MYCLSYCYYYISYVSYYIIYLIIYRERNKASRERKNKRANRAGREREPGRRMPPTSSPVPRFPSVPSAVLTVHTIAQGKGGHPVRFWAKPSPPPRHHLATTSTPIDKQTAGQRLGLSGILPASSSSPSSSPPSGGEGRAASQPGRAIPSRSPCRPSPPCRGAFAYMRTPPERGGGRVNISGRRGCSARKFVSGFFARLYRSKYQLFNFSARLCRAKPVRRGNDNDT